MSSREGNEESIPPDVLTRFADVVRSIRIDPDSPTRKEQLHAHAAQHGTLPRDVTAREFDSFVKQEISPTRRQSLWRLFQSSGGEALNHSEMNLPKRDR